MPAQSVKPEVRPIGFALVTGASSGIGRAFAQRLAEAGHPLVLVARRQGALDDLVHTLPGGPHVSVAADLTSAPGMARVTDFIRTHRVGLLVNNAGAGLYGTYDSFPWEKQEMLLRLNCAAVAELAHGFLTQAQAGDAMINISSIMAFLPQPTSAMYSATKAFVTALSEALWFENKRRGIYVLAVHPGMTRTEFRGRAGGMPIYPKSAHTPEQVVDVAMHHLRRRRKPSVTCGLVNALVCAVPRFLTRQAIVEFLGKARSYQAPKTDA